MPQLIPPPHNFSPNNLRSLQKPVILVAIIILILAGVGGFKYYRIRSLQPNGQIQVPINPSQTNNQSTIKTINSGSGQPSLSMTLDINSIAHNQIQGNANVENKSDQSFTDLYLDLYLRTPDSTTTTTVNGKPARITVLGFLVSFKESGPFDLNTGEKKILPIQLPYSPFISSGDYSLQAFIDPKQGGIVSGASHKIALVGEGKFLTVEAQTCNVVVDNQEFPPNVGPNVNVGQPVQAKCVVQNLSSHTVDVKAKIDYAERYVMNYPLSKKDSTVLPEIIHLKSNEAKLISINLPNINIAQVYEAYVTLLNTSGEQISIVVPFRWVIKGPSAQILDIKTDKNYYQSGEDAKLDLNIVPSMDLFWRKPGNPVYANAGTDLVNPKVEVVISSNGQLCGKTTQSLPEAHTDSWPIQKLTIHIEHDCPNPNIQASVFEGSQLLTNLSIQLLSSRKIVSPIQKVIFALFIIFAIGITTAVLRKKIFTLPLRGKLASIFILLVVVLLVLLAFVRFARSATILAPTGPLTINYWSGFTITGYFWQNGSSIGTLGSDSTTPVTFYGSISGVCGNMQSGFVLTDYVNGTLADTNNISLAFGQNGPISTTYTVTQNTHTGSTLKTDMDLWVYDKLDNDTVYSSTGVDNLGPGGHNNSNSSSCNCIGEVTKSFCSDANTVCSGTPYTDANGNACTGTMTDSAPPGFNLAYPPNGYQISNGQNSTPLGWYPPSSWGTACSGGNNNQYQVHLGTNGTLPVVATISSSAALANGISYFNNSSLAAYLPSPLSPGTTYSWYICASNDNFSVQTCSATWSFSLPSACTTNIVSGTFCTAPTNTCGSNNGTYNSCTYTGPTPCTQIAASPSLCPCSVNACSYGYTCSNGSCVCSNITPSNPPLSSPINGLGVGNTSISLIWGAPFTWGNNCSGNNNQYQLYFGTSSTTPPLVDTYSSSITSYTASSLTQGITYYWYVCASNNGFSTKGCSGIASFSVLDLSANLTANGQKSISQSSPFNNVSVSALAGGSTTISFSSPTNYSTGNGPNSVATADFNKDGKQDFVTLSGLGTTNKFFSVFINNGNNTFTRTDYATNYYAGYLTVADLNGDGYPDIVVANYYGCNVGVFLNKGNGTFGTETDYATNCYPNFVAIGDLNGDGKPDIVVADNGISVLLNNGNGTFAPKASYATASTNPSSLAIGSILNDGKQDILVAHGRSGAFVTAFYNNGNGTFGSEQSIYNVYLQADYVAIADVNGDGYPDIVGAGWNISVYLFDQIYGYPEYGYSTNGIENYGGTLGAYYPFVAIRDVNGDGYPDLVALFTGGGPAIFLNKGNGTFGNQSVYSSGVTGLAIADFNNDGKPDLVSVSSNSANASVLLNNRPTMNYTFWKDCSSTTMSVSDAMTSCGSIPTPSSGTCTSNANGWKCDGVYTNPEAIDNAFSYASAGTYYAKVIVELGSFVAQSQVPITLTSPPTVALKGYSTSGTPSDGPISITSGNSVTLSWTSTNNATSCTASSSPSNSNWSGSEPTSSAGYTISNVTTGTTFSIYCSNAYGNSPTDSFAVKILTASVSANPSSGTIPFSSNFTASAGNTSSGTIRYFIDCTNDGINDFDSGNITSNPYTTTTNPCTYNSGGNYTAKLTVWQSEGTATATTAISACQNAPPSAPSLSSPADNATINNTTTTLAWTAPSNWGTSCSGNTNQYKAFYFPSGQQSSTVYLGPYASSITSANTATLSGNTLYYWQVCASNNGFSTQTCSDARSFTVYLPPTASNLVADPPSSLTYCGGAHQHFSWAFSDPQDGNGETAYESQISTSSNFSSLAYDSAPGTTCTSDTQCNAGAICIIPSGQNSGSCQLGNRQKNAPQGFYVPVSVSPILNQSIGFNTTYYWRVRVFDSAGLSSNWVTTGSSFTTPVHPWPSSAFTYIPSSPSVNETTTFSATSPNGYGTTAPTFTWSFTHATPSTGTGSTAQTKFTQSGPSNSATLTATDDAGTCTTQQSFNIKPPLPQFKEVQPISLLTPFLQTAAEVNNTWGKFLKILHLSEK